MDIGTLSSSLKNIDLQQEVSISLIKMAKENMQVQSESIVKLIESSVTPNLGQNIDVKL